VRRVLLAGAFALLIFWDLFMIQQTIAGLLLAGLFSSIGEGVAGFTLLGGVVAITAVSLWLTPKVYRAFRRSLPPAA
jgi:hypothetical protein